EEHLLLVSRIGPRRDLDVPSGNRPLEVRRVVGNRAQRQRQRTDALRDRDLLGDARSDFERDVGEGLHLGLAVVILFGDALVGREHAQVADDRLRDLEGRAVAAAADRLRENHVDMVTRENEAGDARRDVHWNGDGTHAGAKRRGEEATVLWADERAARDRLTGRDLVANDRAEQLLGIAVRLSLDIIGALHEL